jgi:membrane protein DedA with SNARE-associated domain
MPGNGGAAAGLRWTALWTIILVLVLLPFLLFEEPFTAFGARLAKGEMHGWMLAAAIGALLALDVFLPVPSSLVSTAAGAVLGFWPGVAVIWVGMMIGAGVGYGVGSVAGPAGRWLIGQDGLDRARRTFDRHGAWALALCRAVPVLAEASVVFSGIVRTPLLRFIAVMLLANFGIAVAYAAVGAYAMRIESFLLAFFGAIALPGLAMLLGRRWLDWR